MGFEVASRHYTFNDILLLLDRKNYGCTSVFVSYVTQYDRNFNGFVSGQQRVITV